MHPKEARIRIGTRIAAGTIACGCAGAIYAVGALLLKSGHLHLALAFAMLFQMLRLFSLIAMGKQPFPQRGRSGP